MWATCGADDVVASLRRCFALETSPTSRANQPLSRKACLLFDASRNAPLFVRAPIGRRARTARCNEKSQLGSPCFFSFRFGVYSWHECSDTGWIRLRSSFPADNDRRFAESLLSKSSYSLRVYFRFPRIIEQFRHSHFAWRTQLRIYRSHGAIRSEHSADRLSG